MIRLTNRERWLALGMAVVITAWVLFAFGISPALERTETLSRIIPEKLKELVQIHAKSAQYLALRAEIDDYKAKAASDEKGFELLPFLESINNQLNLTENVTAMKQEVLQIDLNYCEIVVETELKNITLQQLMEFLSKAKSSPNHLHIKSLYTKKSLANPGLLDTTLQIAILKLNNTSQSQNGSI
ncbi:MAG: hypothetical protein WC476_06115 [Phycisphaerae bacterium]|jgi:type II secretory pathway component PulM